MAKEHTQIIAGFIPLLDSAVLVTASEMGFCEREGLELKLIRETSWANIRDRIAVGHFDVAHMLAPMPIAASLNLTSLAVPMLAPMLLGLGGNAITVSPRLWSHMKAAGADPKGDPSSTGQALAKVIAGANSGQGGPFRFGVVHPFSGHAYELRYWMAASGIDPENDVEIRVLPPQVMADALASGQIDGCCVGEPWNSAAVASGAGRIVTYKQAIWPDSPEKVLGVTKKWAGENPETLDSLMRALSAAADWCSKLENAVPLAALLAKPEFLDCPADICLPALTGQIAFEPDLVLEVPDFLSFSGGEKAAPVPAQGVWFYQQMVRWKQTVERPDELAEVAEIFSDSLYRRALDLKSIDHDREIRLFDGSLITDKSEEPGILGAD